MSALSIPADRNAQELQFVDVIKTIEQGVCTPENAKAFEAAGASIIEMIKSGLDFNKGFEKEDLEHFTPIGLFNAMAKDLIPAKGVLKLEGITPSVAMTTIESMKTTYREVISTALDANAKLVMHTLGDDPDLEDFQSTQGMMDLKDATLVGRCLQAGIVFNPDSFSHLNRKDIVVLMSDPTLLGHVQKLNSKNPLIENLNEVNALLLLRPEELKDHLSGPARQFIPDEALNHAFHCAVANRAKPEAIEAWLDAGASIEGSARSLFNKTALGSAIFGSPLHGAQDRAVNPNETENSCLVELLVKRGAIVNPAGTSKSPLAQAYEKGSTTLIDLLESKGALFANESEKKEAYLLCAEHGSDEALLKLLSQNVGIDEIVSRTTRSPATDKFISNQHTALTMAAMMGKASTVDMLLEGQANPEIKVARVVAFASHDEQYELNFIQEALRLDHPQVLEVAVKHLGIDFVLNENVPHRSSKCLEFVQAIKAAQVASVATHAASPSL